MAKHPARLAINLDLLRPQGRNPKLTTKLLQWLLSAGRYLIVFVEIIVLGAFLIRFKLDADIAATKESIDQQVPYIKSLKTEEDAIRQIQFQLTTIKSIKQKTTDYKTIFKKIANQTPAGVTISSINLEQQGPKTNLKIAGTSKNNADLSTFVSGLKTEKSFSEVNLLSAGLEEGSIDFAISAVAAIPQGVSQ